MKKILIPLASLVIANIFAQQQSDLAALPNIIPPSPTAYALGNYGNVPVGLFTGSPNVSIPLLAYKTNNITLPISLFYGSNGIKVDDVSTNVGLGWSLNFGGVITRTVRDRADESSTHISTPENVSGAYANAITNKFLSTIGNGSTSLDTEADLYSFNFNGNSGKFFFDQNDVPHIVDQQAIKIEKSTEGFVLTLPNGEKYYFNETEQTMYTSSGNGHSVPSGAITAWYLTKIAHPNGDEVYFTYSAANITEYIGSQSQNLKMSVGYPAQQASCQGGSGYVLPPTMGMVADNNIEILGKKIVSINSNNTNAGTITFEYETDTTTLDVDGNKKIKVIRQLDRNGNILESTTFNYLNTSNKRNFLSSLVFKDPFKNYSFEYESPSLFPARLSFSQDQWGYYNGKANANLVPANISDYNLKNFNYNGANKEPDPNFAKIGMLKRVTYPTKGYTDLEYEGNTYWGEKTIYPAITTQNISIRNTISVDDFVSTSYTFTSPINQTVKVTGSAVFNTQCTDQTHSPIGIVHGASFYKIIQGAPTQVGSDYQFLGNDEVLFEAVAGQTYTITIDAGRCTYTRAGINYYATAPQVINTNLDTGGVRIKSTKDVDTPTSQNIYKRYYYAHKDDLTHSSGQKGNNPYYVDVAKWQTSCGVGVCTYVENSNVILSSSSMIPLYNTETSSCLYPFVTISEGGDQFEKGGEMKEFKIRRDNAGSNIWGSGGLSSAPWTNRGWDNGSELKSTILRKNSSTLEVVQEKENIYEKNDNNTFELKSFAGRKLYDMICPANYSYTCTATDVAAAGNECSGKAVGTQVYLTNVDNISVTEYRNISYWHYLKSQKTTDFLNGLPVVTQTEYFYNNPSNYQLSKQKVTFPDAIVNETTYSYAHEKGNQLMIGKNMVGIPLETVSTQTIGSTTKTLSKTETIYPSSVPTAETGSLVLPTSVLTHDIPNNSTITEVKYDKYDANGNLLQYTSKAGIPVAIVWGYNNTQPIAKVEGTTYDQLVNSGLISAIVSASDNDATDPNTEGTLRNVLDSFRNNSSLSGYQITTITYNPLIGVTSMTPPSGIREVYIYDSFNRLKEIRENDVTGNLLKEFNYNYKH